ncbi:hypothetical protein MMC20_001177 [Loxospora ochrophaea]|nr:hypothetical protein [Loxospora ochrophaea]
MRRRLIDEALEEAKELGIRNILALRGDPPRGEEYRVEDTGEEQEQDDTSDWEELKWAVDLVRYIRRTHGDYFCIGVAAYPEGHADESYPTSQDPRNDMPYLLEKIRAGADFIMTQLFYDGEAYLRFERLVREYEGGVLKDIPIIPGLMPIQSYQVLRRTTKLSHANLPQQILARVEKVKGDDDKVKAVGVDVVSEIVDGIKRVNTGTPRGFHFYTLNLEKAVGFILEKCQLIAPVVPTDLKDAEIDFVQTSSNVLPTIEKPNSTNESSSSSEKQPSPSSSKDTVLTFPEPETYHDDSSDQTRATSLAISQGQGSLGREATWDDYPNGRFGDARSPAFGEIDGYGAGLHVSLSHARQLWGRPTSRAEISSIFRLHIMGKLEALPWSEAELNEETIVIKEQLTSLIEKGMWSVASQPAVDGVGSDHKIFGWGPTGGFVFQKAFVEFFMPKTDWQETMKNRLKSEELADEVSWYSVDAEGDFETSEKTGAVNSVTWGVFPGKEIVTPTIVEEMNFRAWGEEAFAIWGEWERVYNAGSDTAKFLRRCREELVLVNAICHDYREPERLWQILVDG